MSEKMAGHTAQVVTGYIEDYDKADVLWLPTVESQRAVLGNITPSDAPILVILPKRD